MISKNQVKLIRQLEQKKYRQREGVSEGPKVVGDLMRRWKPVAVFATDDYTPSVAMEVQRITADELHRISLLQHPQQVLALFPLPNVQRSTFNVQRSIILALDGVQDPGNLGTIIRIADWFGIDDIVCSEDTADAWNPKVVQATMGSDNIYSQPLSARGIIVMGNEGNGLSAEVRRRVTHRLLIPSFREGDGAESLNVAVATAIVCSEFKRSEK